MRAIFATLCVTANLIGCVPTQLHRNADDLIGTVASLRQKQVLRNISAAIDDPDAVPVHVVLTQGSAQVSASAGPTFKLPRFNLSQTSKELDIAASDQWTDQWQFIPVTATDDLTRLRTIYGLIVKRTRASTEEHSAMAILSLPPHSGFSSRQDIAVVATTEKSNETPKPPTEEQIVEQLNEGISEGCSTYLKRTPDKVWLYWKNSHVQDVPANAESVGTYGGNEIFIASRSCFDDFILMVQSTTTNTMTQAIAAGRSFNGTLVNP